MEFESILVSKALPDGKFSQKAVIDTHRTITSSNDLRDFTAGTIRSSRGKVDACVYTRESVCREAASFETDFVVPKSDLLRTLLISLRLERRRILHRVRQHP
jgi:hypothetical protein